MSLACTLFKRCVSAIRENVLIEREGRQDKEFHSRVMTGNEFLVLTHCQNALIGTHLPVHAAGHDDGRGCWRSCRPSSPARPERRSAFTATVMPTRLVEH